MRRRRAAAHREGGQRERRVHRPGRGAGDRLRGRPRRADRQPQPRRPDDVGDRASARSQYAVAHGVLLVAAAGNEYSRAIRSSTRRRCCSRRLERRRRRRARRRARRRDGMRARLREHRLVGLARRAGRGRASARSRSSRRRSHIRARAAGRAARALRLRRAAPRSPRRRSPGAAALVWAANPSLTAQQVAQILKETASGHGAGRRSSASASSTSRPRWRRLGGRAERAPLGESREHEAALNWSGSAPRYSLSFSVDAGTMRPCCRHVADDDDDDARRGHTYAFSVTALDGGRATATRRR